MNVLVRQVLAVVVVMAVILAWWFPAPLLLRLELVDWGRLYESQYAQGGSGLGVMGMSREFARSITEPLPLNRFIASKVADRLTDRTDPAWAEIVASLDSAPNAAAPATRYVAPDREIFANLPGTEGYLRWRDGVGVRYLGYRFVPAMDFSTRSIPEDVRFPLRDNWVGLLAAVVGAVLLWGWGGRATDLVAGSSAGRGLRWSAIFAVVCGGAVAWPFVYQCVGSDLSFASIFAGGFFLLGGLTGMWLFGRQAAMLRRLVAGGYLACFSYAPEEWTRFVEWNFGQETGEKKALWWFIFVITLVIGLGFMAVMRDAASVWVFVGLMGLMAVLRVLAVVLPRRGRRRHLRGPGLVYVGQDGLYLNGTVHSWNSWGARLDKTTFRRDPAPHLEVVYSYLMVAGRTLFFYRNFVWVRVPVPSGQEETGLRVATELGRVAAGKARPE